MATVLARTNSSDKKQGTITVTTTPLINIPPLGVPIDERRFWWQRLKTYDPDAIATLVCGRSILVKLEVR